MKLNKITYDLEKLDCYITEILNAIFSERIFVDDILKSILLIKFKLINLKSEIRDILYHLMKNECMDIISLEYNYIIDKHNIDSYIDNCDNILEKF